MNKIEGLRGFLTFCLLLLALIILFLSVRFIISKRTLREESEASSVSQEKPMLEEIPVAAPSGAQVSIEPVSAQGFQQALSEQDLRYDLNEDSIVNMYDYYLLVSLSNQTPDNN